MSMFEKIFLMCVKCSGDIPKDDTPPPSDNELNIQKVINPEYFIKRGFESKSYQSKCSSLPSSPSTLSSFSSTLSIPSIPSSSISSLSLSTNSQSEDTKSTDDLSDFEMF